MSFDWLVRIFRRKAKFTLVPTMSYVDRAIIHDYACGNHSLRERAIGIHRRYIPVLGVRGTPEQDFMAEVDTGQPDLGLRAEYRKRLCES